MVEADFSVKLEPQAEQQDFTSSKIFTETLSMGFYNSKVFCSENLYCCLKIFVVKVCGVGWEVWWNYGIWAGDPVDQRRPESLNTIMPKHINWILNSLDDGSICMGAIILIYFGMKKDTIPPDIKNFEIFQ